MTTREKLEMVKAMPKSLLAKMVKEQAEKFIINQSQIEWGKLAAFCSIILETTSPEQMSRECDEARVIFKRMFNEKKLNHEKLFSKMLQ